MSSFPQHEQNIKKLNKMGFDVSDSMEGGEVTGDSWGYDELTYTLADIVKELENAGFTLGKLITKE